MSSCPSPYLNTLGSSENIFLGSGGSPAGEVGVGTKAAKGSRDKDEWSVIIRSQGHGWKNGPSIKTKRDYRDEKAPLSGSGRAEVEENRERGQDKKKLRTQEANGKLVLQYIPTPISYKCIHGKYY